MNVENQTREPNNYFEECEYCGTQIHEVEYKLSDNEIVCLKCYRKLYYFDNSPLYNLLKNNGIEPIIWFKDCEKIFEADYFESEQWLELLDIIEDYEKNLRWLLTQAKEGYCATKKIPYITKGGGNLPTYWFYFDFTLKFNNL